MSAELAPRADDLGPPTLQPAPPTAPQRSAPSHSEGDDVYFDPMELISV
jgi:hypothetical protein